MSTRQIKITVDPLGNTKIDAEGFQGESCLDATRGLELALQGASQDRNLKPEYDEAENTSTEAESLRF